MKRTGGIGVKVEAGRVTIEAFDGEGRVLVNVPTTPRGLFKLSDMLGKIASDLTGLNTNDEIDAYLEGGNDQEDGVVEVRKLEKKLILPAVSMN